VDKYEPAVVNQAFLRNSDLLREVDCHLVFTIQSSLLYKPVEDAVEQCFTKFTLPMLPVFVRRSRELNSEVVEKIREAVYRRVPKELFAEDEGVNELIKASGGGWRDLLRLLQEALLSADKRIGPAEVKAAVQQVARRIDVFCAAARICWRSPRCICNIPRYQMRRRAICSITSASSPITAKAGTTSIPC
jgi:hypothetical protein